MGMATKGEGLGILNRENSWPLNTEIHGFF